MFDTKGQANPGLIVLVVVLIIGLIVVLFVLPREDDADVEIDLGALEVPAALADASTPATTPQAFRLVDSATPASSRASSGH